MTAEELLKKGIALLKENNFLGALTCLEKAYGLKKTPEIQSYLGFCIAVERGKITESVTLCNKAISAEPENPVHYLNLGRTYLKAGKKTEAIDTLRKGLSFGDNKEIRNVLENLGTRRKTVLPFFSRDNFLNKYIGLLLHRLRLR